MVSEKPSLEIDNLGEYLRAQRTAQRVSLEELSMRTRISGRFLEAIEGNRFDLLPNPVSARGFLRSYARALGLPEEPILQRHGELTKPADTAQPDSQDGRAKPLIRPAPAAEPISRAMRLWIPLGILGTVVLVVWMVSRGSVERIGDRGPGPSQPEGNEAGPPPSENPSDPLLRAEEPVKRLQPPVAVNPPTPSTVEFPETPISPRQKPSGSLPVPQAPFLPDDPSVAISSPPEEQRPLVLVVEAVEPSWLEVVIDGGPIREALLQPGDRVRWEAQERFLLNLGNAGGVNVSYNGKSLEPFGPSGKVIKGIELSR